MILLVLSMFLCPFAFSPLYLAYLVPLLWLHSYSCPFIPVRNWNGPPTWSVLTLVFPSCLFWSAWKYLGLTYCLTLDCPFWNCFEIWYSFENRNHLLMFQNWYDQNMLLLLVCFNLPTNGTVKKIHLSFGIILYLYCFFVVTRMWQLLTSVFRFLGCRCTFILICCLYFLVKGKYLKWFLFRLS